jgi:hypothetical protein
VLFRDIASALAIDLARAVPNAVWLVAMRRLAATGLFDLFMSYA